MDEEDVEVDEEDVELSALVDPPVPGVDVLEAGPRLPASSDWGQPPPSTTIPASRARLNPRMPPRFLGRGAQPAVRKQTDYQEEAIPPLTGDVPWLPEVGSALSWRAGMGPPSAVPARRRVRPILGRCRRLDPIAGPTLVVVRSPDHPLSRTRFA